MQVLQLVFTKIYIASFVFEFSNSKQIMKCKLQMKTNEDEIGILGCLNLASLKCAFLPRASGT